MGLLPLRGIVFQVQVPRVCAVSLDLVFSRWKIFAKEDCCEALYINFSHYRLMCNRPPCLRCKYLKPRKNTSYRRSVTTIQVMVQCSATSAKVAARALQITTADRTSYGQARLTAAPVTITTILAMVPSTITVVTPIPTPLLCAVSLDLEKLLRTTATRTTYGQAHLTVQVIIFGG